MNPASGEGEKAFVSRCIEHEVSKGRDQDQAVAMCYAMWDKTALARKRRPYLRETQDTFIARYCASHPEATVAHALAAWRLGPADAEGAL